MVDNVWVINEHDQRIADGYGGFNNYFMLPLLPTQPIAPVTMDNTSPQMASSSSASHLPQTFQAVQETLTNMIGKVFEKNGQQEDLPMYSNGASAEHSFSVSTVVYKGVGYVYTSVMNMIPPKMTTALQTRVTAITEFTKGMNDSIGDCIEDSVSTL
jgi:hypothetical protein